MLDSGFSMLGEGEGQAVQGCRLKEVYRERELLAISMGFWYYWTCGKQERFCEV